MHSSETRPQTLYLRCLSHPAMGLRVFRSKCNLPEKVPQRALGASACGGLRGREHSAAVARSQEAVRGMQ